MTDEALEELASSIKAQGIIQPIVVRELSKNKFEIIIFQDPGSIEMQKG
mgnify:CR=1 FL=1